MRIIEGLEGKGFRLPLTKGEAELSEKLTAITRQVFFIFAVAKNRTTRIRRQEMVWPVEKLSGEQFGGQAGAASDEIYAIWI